MIDVIIPACRGFAQTRRCLDSVLSARVIASHEVVVIFDASPEAELRAWLGELARAGHITLVAHERNAGRVASANEGMRLHRKRDVVLLDSDTEVADGWLDRLAACARREGVGTATPFSNNAGIASYPCFDRRNALAGDASTRALDELFARVNVGRYVDIPTGMGFCTFIARRCLDETGLFDEAAFGDGYGGEVDFCLRASEAGWRHVLAADVFVFHEGDVSFGTDTPIIREAGRGAIDARHPEFRPRLADFLARDPLRPLRRAVDLERIRADPRAHLLFVSHRWGGGVDRHMRDLAAAIAEEAQVLTLRPAGRGTACLAWLRDGEEFEAFFDTAREWDLLVDLLASLAIARVHFHHTHGLPEAVLDLPAALGVPWDVTLHDYLVICPQLHLADENGRYCGEPDDAGCNRCLATRAPPWNHDIRGWRERFGLLLAGAARVIAPSHDVAQRLRRYHPDLAVRVWPHAEAMREAAPAAVRVLLLGGISAIKGFDVLAACVQDASRRALPLHFRVLGHLEHSLPLWPAAPLTVAGSFPEGELDRLLAQERGDVIFFPAQVPESFSYTLGAAMRTGLPIVATDLGALPERLAGYPAATIVPWDAPAEAINDALLAARPRSALHDHSATVTSPG